ncbi:beta strand repeat-containing protein, partial [Maribacter sp. 4G9]|uniref:beta strand repeat-containing protein n=1 Tax=Maribacter sp. 4G9 TaxID=1889777 RepID=UPI001055CF46
MDKRILWIFLLLSGITFAQTTVTLEDQCNCEVLQGTAVTTAGANTPGGADLGDLYVNTNTGTIFFWDGNSWELTSSDNNTTNASFTENGTDLILTDSDGNSLTVALADIAAAIDTNTTNNAFLVMGTDLVMVDSDGNMVGIPLAQIAALTDTNTTNTSLTEDGTNIILTDSDGGTVTLALADIAAATDTNTTNATFAVVGTNLVITDSDGNTVSVPVADIAALTDTNTTNTGLTEDGTNLILTDSDGGTVTVALADITAGVDTNTTNTSLTEDGTNLILTDSDGGTVTIPLADIAAATDTNTTNATFAVVGTDLVITDSDGNTVSVPVADIAALTDTNTTNTGLTEDGTNLILTDSDGNTVTIPLADIAAATDTNTTNATFAVVGTDLVITDSDGGTVTVALADITAGVDTNTTNTSLTEDGTNIILTDSDGGTVTLALADIDTNTTNDRLEINGSNLELEDSDGTILSVSLAALAAATDTNTTNATFAVSGTDLVITDSDNNTVSVPLADITAGVDTDEQDLELDGSNILSLTNDATPVDLSGYLDNTDDQTASEVNIADAGGNFTATDVEGALSELAAGSTDDQNLTGATLDGSNQLQIDIEGGSSATVDLSSLVGTDDQTASEVNITDAGGNFTATDVEGALSELAAGSTDDQNLTGATLDGSNQLQIDIEGGTSATVDLSSLVGTDDQTASEVNITDAGGNFTATDVEGALSELAAGSTDDQNLTGATLDGSNQLQIDIEGGSSATVDLSSLVGTDDQTASEVNITDAGGNFTATDVEGALSELAAGSTDDQNLTGATLDGSNQLQIDIEGGTSATVDLSSLVGTDDQTAGEVTYDNSTSGLTAGDVQSAIDEVVAGSTDDQNISGSSFNGATNELTIGIEGGTSETVDLSGLVGTDDQNLIGATLDGSNQLQIDIEGGSSATVDLSSLVGTDDQTAGEVTYDNSTSGLTAGDVQSAIDEVAAGSTDDQNISGSSFNGATNELTIGIEGGTSETVDLSGLVGTDDQTAAEVTVADVGGNFANTEVEGVLEEIDARIDALVLAGGSDGNDFVTGGSLSGTDLTLNVPNQIDPVIDLSGLQDGTGTDDQNISGSSFNGATNELTIGIEGGTSETVDLSGLVGTDDQTASEVNITDAGGNFTATDVEGALSELAAGSTDDQNLTGATLDGSNQLQIDIEGGTSATVDLSSLVGTDDQTASEVNITDAGGNFTATDVEGALSELAAGSTDDQNLTGATLD